MTDGPHPTAQAVVRAHPARVVDGLLVMAALGQLAELVGSPPAHAVAVGVLMALGPLALLVRRRVPVPAILIALGAQVALLQLLPRTQATTFLTFLLVVGVAGTLPLVASVVGLAGALGVAAEGAWLDRAGGGAGDFALSAAIMTGIWTCGLVVSRSARAAARSADQLHEARRSREAAAAEAVRDERERMTRELHDAVAHGLTVLVVQTVAAQEDLEHGETGARLAQRLRTTEEVARESLLELRTLLGILGTGDDPPVSTGLAGIEALVGRLSTPEFPVTLRFEDLPERCGHAAELAAYRAVQEGLTNALKHGDGSGAAVVLGGGGDELRVEVSNGVRHGTSSSAGTGRGLPGLQSRLAGLGGTLEVRREAGRFQLRCLLPVPHDVTPAVP